MPKYVVNPLTGNLDAVLTSEEIQASVQNKQNVDPDLILQTDFEDEDVSAWTIVASDPQASGDAVITPTVVANSTSPVSGSFDLKYETSGDLGSSSIPPYAAISLVINQTSRDQRQLLVEFDIELEQFFVQSGFSSGSSLSFELWDIDSGTVFVERVNVGGTSGDFLSVSKKFDLPNNTSTNYELRLVGYDVPPA